MSSHKHRNKHRSPSDKRHSNRSLDDSRTVNNSYEKESYDNDVIHRKSGHEHDDHRKNKKQHSKDRSCEKIKKSKLQESDDEQYERNEVGYSKISSHDGRNKDYNKFVRHGDVRDSEANKYKSDGYNDDDDCYSRNDVRNITSEQRSYNEKERKFRKSDKNRGHKGKEYICDDDDYDYYSRDKIRNKVPDDSFHSREKKRHGNYDHNSDDDYISKSHHRDSHSKKHTSDNDDSDDRSFSNTERARNSKHNSYNETYQKTDNFYDLYDRGTRRSATDRRSNQDYSGSKRRGESYRENMSSKRDNTYDNHLAQPVTEVRQDTRSEKNGSTKSDGGEINKETNPNDLKAPKKMLSGAYIPPAKLRLMQQEISDKGSIEYQRIAWEALKKSINGLTNKVNTSNIAEIVKELFRENIVRGRGVLTRALMQAQALSPTFTHVYAALVAIINTKFPEISELLLKRLILQFKRGFRRNDKQVCLSSVRFIAHLLNQQVAHEVLILEILTLLLEHPTDHSVEVAIAMLKECGKRLEELSKRGCDAIFSRLRHILHEGNLDRRTQYMIEVLFAVRKDKFKDYPSVVQELDLVEENDKFTHLVTLDEDLNAEEMLNVFKFDSEYQVNEERYKELVNEILGDSDSEDSGDSEAAGTDSDEENDEAGETEKIVDMTETNLVALRRNIYLTIQSSLDFEECAHKLLKMELKPGEIMEMCYMILDCCAQQRTYEKFYGLLAQRFCQLNKVYMEPFMEIFRNSYETIHRLETNKLRNVAKFFAHLLYTDAIEWNVLSNIKLNENDTTSSSRIFIKILFQELSEYMGLPTLNKRVKDVTLQEAFDGLFPRDNPHNTRFAINFFTSIGLGGLTDELREHLKTAPKNPAVMQAINEKPPESDDSSEDSSSSSSPESDSDDEEPPRKKGKARGEKKAGSSSQNRGKSSSRTEKHKSHKKSSRDVKQKRKHRR